MGKLTVLRQYAEEYWLEHWGYKLMPARQQRFIGKLRKRGRVKVAFFVLDVAMWKYQGLYEQLQADARFETFIVLSPSNNHSHEQQVYDLQHMRAYFDAQKMAYIDWRLEDGAPPPDVRRSINPDIVFYTQPYHGAYHPKHSFLQFTDRLLAYYPYAYLLIEDPYIYDGPFLNIAWKLYYYDRFSLQNARQFARNKARNVVVTGYPNADVYMQDAPSTAWKDAGHSKKRLIWAPHFTLSNDGSPFSRSNFLDLCDFMPQLAQRYRDQLQIAFKPHPSLMRELCNHPQWGKERAEAYYRQWADMPNTQLELSGFVDLFRGSDAMVHDSGSFVIDYMYFNKPVMYIAKDIERTKRQGNQLSRMAYEHHYIGKTQQDITDFVEKTVLGGDDPLKEARLSFRNEYLLPANGKSVARNTYEDMIASLGL